ncbi:MAG: PadR family transcriptional regulator [Acidimicrobiales bacterium]
MSVRNGLLSLLGEGPTYGFQLKTQFEETTGGVWSLNVGQVYTTLDRLERDGLVTVREDDGQKIYRLTDAGEDELGAWWEAVPGDEPPPRDELLLKLLLALPHGRDHALDVLSRQRAALLELLARRSRPVDRSSSTAPVSGLAADLVADAVLMRAEADLRWLDRCESRILAADVTDLGRSVAEPDPDPSDPPDVNGNGNGNSADPSHSTPPASRRTTWRARPARTKENRR